MGSSPDSSFWRVPDPSLLVSLQRSWDVSECGGERKGAGWEGWGRGKVSKAAETEARQTESCENERDRDRERHQEEREDSWSEREKWL